MVTSRYTQVPTLIFDEVDTGIGGGVAETVGRALRRLGKQHQVLAVTHLPQVASCGENHWQAHKHSNGAQTLSEISALMPPCASKKSPACSAAKPSPTTTRRHAEEMLALAACQ